MAKQIKIVALGLKKEFSCLRAAGVEVIPVESGQEFEEALRRQATDTEVGVVIASESLAERERHAFINELRHQTGTVILVVPSYEGPKETTLSFMKHALEQSIGVDLISKA